MNFGIRKSLSVGVFLNVLSRASFIKKLFNSKNVICGVWSVKGRLVVVPSEHEEQVSVFEWAELAAGRWPELRLMFAIPNGGARHIVVARKLKAEGVRAGVPDIFLPVSRGGFFGLFIEMKRVKGGRVSEDQEPWCDKLRNQGYAVEVCRGAAEATKVLVWYMSLGSGETR